MAATPNMVRAIGNEASSTLSAPMSDSTLSFTLNDGSNFSALGGMVIIDEGIVGKEECVYVESKVGSTFSVSSDGRGLSDTSPVSHDNGATVSDIIVTDHINSPRASFLNQHNDDGSHKTLSGLNLTSPVITGGTISGAALTTATITAPTLVLKNSVPTTLGEFAYEQTDKNLSIGTGADTLRIRMDSWKSWTPANYYNFTLSNGTAVGAHAEIGKIVFVRLAITFGTLTSLTGTFQFDLPFIANAAYLNRQTLGEVTIDDTGNNTFAGRVWSAPGNPTTRAEVVVLNASSTYLGYNVFTSTIPFTWGSTDGFTLNLCYERA